MVEKTTNSDINIKSTPVTIAEPAAFGLFGLAVAAFVLGATDLGLTSSSKSLMIPWILKEKISLVLQYLAFMQ